MRRRASEESGGRQTANRTARLGGISGLLYVVLFIPAYVVGYPDALDRTSNEQGVSAYFDEVGTFLFFNGTLSIFAAFFFIWFLGALHGILRSAEEEAGWFSSVALAGGVVFVTLAWAGVAVEIAYPATLGRFADFDPDAQLVFVTLALASWLYHFCQLGMAALVSATSVIALETRVLPRWLALAGFAVALLALLHFLVPLLAALIGMLWVAVVSVLMLIGGPRAVRQPAR